MVSALRECEGAAEIDAMEGVEFYCGTMKAALGEVLEMVNGD